MAGVLDSFGTNRIRGRSRGEPDPPIFFEQYSRLHLNRPEYIDAEDSADDLAEDSSALIRVYRSSDAGSSWRVIPVDNSTDVQSCPAYANCQEEMELLLTSSAAIASDEDNTVYLFYTANHGNRTPARPFVSVSKDKGSSWSVPMDVSDAPKTDNVFHSYPMVAAGVAGDVRVAWMDNRTGMFNLFYRCSSDSGQTWEDTVLLSTTHSDSLESYQSAKGFLFPNGEYSNILIDGDGMSHVVFGEGAGWNLKGNSFYVREFTPNSSLVITIAAAALVLVSLVTAAVFVISIFILAKQIPKMRRYERL